MLKNIAQKLKTLSCLCLIFLLWGWFVRTIYAQEVVDKTVATVSDGASKPVLITYSDLLWQLALESDTPLSPPTSDGGWQPRIRLVASLVQRVS